MAYKIDDGFYSYLVEGAKFEGKYQIPCIQKSDLIKIPKDMIPFDKRHVIKEKDLAIHFYIHDKAFKQIINSTWKYVEELSKYSSVISPDCSLYRDMPLSIQIINTYFNRAVGYYLQKNGVHVITNIRWGDERSFEFCFAGAPKNDIVSISTYGCIKSEEDKYYFKFGLREMLRILKPKIVLVHGAMPDEVFSEFISRTEFISYKSYISRVKGDKRNG